MGNRVRDRIGSERAIVAIVVAVGGIKSVWISFSGVAKSKNQPLS